MVRSALEQNQIEFALSTWSSFTLDRLWPKPMETLRVALADWTDFDVSAHVLAQCLGIMPSGLGMKEAKSVYWSDNPLGNMLYATLERLLELGALERREEPDLQYRWCSDYRVDMGHA
jgi:hypothetical protein